MKGQVDFQLLRLEIPALVTESHPLPSSSPPDRETQVGVEWRGQIWGDTRILSISSLFHPSLMKDRGLVPPGLSPSTPSALQSTLTSHSIVKKHLFSAPSGNGGAIGHLEVIFRIVIPDPWGTE